MTDADWQAERLVQQHVRNWVHDALSAAPDMAATVPELRPLLWAQMPAIVRDSYVALKVGDDLSRTLRSLPDVSHDARSGVWRIVSIADAATLF